jgi:hypothetical protein
MPALNSVTPQRDVIELPISDELDINGWDLRKALGLLKRGNATLIEWVDAIVTDPALRPNHVRESGPTMTTELTFAEPPLYEPSGAT